MSAEETLIEPVAGLRVRWGEGELTLLEDPGPERVGLVRLISGSFDDGRSLALVAARPAGAKGHGEEAVSAVLIGPESEPVELDDALLSTQYDADGVIVRAGIELWPEESGYALRVAADRTGAPEGEPHRQSCSLTLRLGGVSGTGTYSLWDRRS